MSLTIAIDGPVKQPGIKIGKSEIGGNRVADRAFTRRRRPVNCDGQAPVITGAVNAAPTPSNMGRLSMIS